VTNVPAVANTDVTNDGAEDASILQKNVVYAQNRNKYRQSCNHEYLFFVFQFQFMQQAPVNK